MTTTDATQLRKRSPAYPFYSIKECVDFINKLEKQIAYDEVAAEFAIRKMNMSPKSSGAQRALSSLLGYGLLTSKGEGAAKTVRLSETSRILIIGIGNDRVEACRRAVLNDDMMKQVWDLWKWDLPNDRETIISKLKLNWQFRDDAAKRFAYVIRENYELANLRDFSGSSLGADKKICQEVEPPKPPPPPSLEISSTMRKANLLLGNNREILIYVPIDLTEEEFKRIPSWLEIQKYGLLGGNSGKE